MEKHRKCNQGFSLIELLIAMAILSIIMIMIVQFMGTTSAAYRKTKKNLGVQNEAMQVMNQMSDTLMQASYIRIATKDKGMYEITKTDTSKANSRSVTELSSAYTPVTFDYVPDNYGNYAKQCKLAEEDREVIVDFDTYQLLDKTSADPYPLTSDADYIDGIEVRSFRALKQGGNYCYIKPEFIYVEYPGTAVDDTGAQTQVVKHVLYYVTEQTDKVKRANSKDDTCSIYMYRYDTDPADTSGSVHGYSWARTNLLNLLGKGDPSRGDVPKDSDGKIVFEPDTVEESTKNAIKNGVEGLVTNMIADFYLSADVEGNSLLTNVMFRNDGYIYNVVETVKFRNSNVLTVRPQKLMKKRGSGVSGSGSAGE